MSKFFKLLFLLMLTAVTGIQSARILAYFPTPSISHQVVFRPITQELAKRGHEVIVVTPNPVFTEEKAPSNLTEIDVHDLSYNSGLQLFQNHTGERSELFSQILAILKAFSTIFELQMQSPQVQNMLENKDSKYFDLLLLEACNRPVLGFARKFEAPIILLSSFGAIPAQYRNFGAPSHPLLYPTSSSQRLYNLTFWEKGSELFKQWILEILLYLTEEHDYNIVKKHFDDNFSSFKQVRKSIKMMFLNEHPIWAENRPVPPSIQFMGGIHEVQGKDLPKDLKNYLDSSKNGVIYVSFGTNVLPSLLSLDRIEIMANSFAKLPYDILWKWDNDTLTKQSKNIKIMNWLPQTDVLRHPNVKLFITQGGLQSTDEAIDAAVPLIGIPIIGDQWYNVEKYVHHGIGAQLNLNTLNEKEFKETIKTVISDKRYKDNVVRLRSLMRTYPVKPLDNVIWWIEHVIAYGGDHLKSPAADISWAEYYEIKLVVIGIAIILSILIFIVYVLKQITNFIYENIKWYFKIKVE